MSNEERARIARENGAKSRGPKTAAGKEKSKRNAIKHGERAEALKLLVPPHSACLLHEERLVFYDLFDRNLAKYRATDDHEKELVREMTSLQWSNGRNRVALNARSTCGCFVYHSSGGNCGGSARTACVYVL